MTLKIVWFLCVTAFFFVCQRKICYEFFNSLTSSHLEYNMINIPYQNSCSLEQLIEQNISQILNKKCMVCHRNTKHTDSHIWQPVDEMQQYKFRLIDHIGCSANSGHYTSTVFRNDSGFHCNDQVITDSAGVTGGYSSTAYMMFCVLSS